MVCGRVLREGFSKYLPRSCDRKILRAVLGAICPKVALGQSSRLATTHDSAGADGSMTHVRKHYGRAMVSSPKIRGWARSPISWIYRGG